MTDTGRTTARKLDNVLASYMDIDGLTAAALVSADGLLVASAGDSANLEAIAAHTASAMSSAASLAAELGTGLPRMTLALPDQALVFAPLTGDLFLVLIGNQSLLTFVSDRRSTL
ncbi:MAG: roadblock/LC7 domain-containing protein [Thermoleophilia bacterium]|jgi:predicted regulator of Ras-like GTPase activity (Roadblock/LC7/MglB family)